MRLTQYCLALLRESPSESQIVSHRLMLRAGMIRQSSAGIYSWLPLGLRVLKRVEQIVREEQDRSGALEILMPTVQPAELWRESGRYDDYGNEMLRINDRHDREILHRPPTHQHPTHTPPSSPKTSAEHPERFCAPWTGVSAARDGMRDPENCAIPAEELVTARRIEVGHIFYFGTKYSVPLGALVAGPDGEMAPLEMGSYGIGVSRLPGALVEAEHHDTRVIWPDRVAPFRLGLFNLPVAAARRRAPADALY